MKHYCNPVTYPITCCPLAHGEKDERFCTCTSQVSPWMADAVKAFQQALCEKRFTQISSTGDWVQRKHRVYISHGDWIVKRVECFDKHNVGSVHEGYICSLCQSVIDWVETKETQ